MGIAASAQGLLAALSFLSTATTAVPEAPPLTATQMNCGDTTATADAGLTEREVAAIETSLAKIWDAKAKSRDWRHARRHDGCTLMFCSVTSGGRRYIIIDGIYMFLGVGVCNDLESFGVKYDPETKRFGDIMFPVSACAPSTSKPT